MTWSIRIEEFRYHPQEPPVLRDLAFTIEPGRIHHVCGPSGCGKSTLLGLLGGQLPSAGGSHVWRGDLGGFPTTAACRSAQDPLLQIAGATVIDDLLLGPEYREDTPERAVDKAVASARRFGLLELIDRDTSRLSFGQARLLGLAGLWQYPAPVLLLDEPFVGLDARRQRQMQEAIVGIAAEGTAVVLTHTQRLPEELTIDLRPVTEEDCGEPPAFSVRAARGDLVATGLIWAGWAGGGAVGFRLGPGELLLLTGPNGAGKTQLLHHLAGVKEFSTGRVEWPGPVTLVPQNPEQEIFAPDVQTELLVGADAAPEVARSLAEWFGLAGCWSRSPLLLSYGQQKRVSLLGGLLRRPAVLLLDEPLAGLDAGNRGRLLTLLRAFLAGGGLALVATHEPELFTGFAVGRLHLEPAASPAGFVWQRAWPAPTSASPSSWEAAMSPSSTPGTGAGPSGERAIVAPPIGACETVEGLPPPGGMA